ncbi:MAG: FHA domain-containing protein [Myxococcota bacterium]
MRPTFVLRVLRASDPNSLPTGLSFILNKDVIVGRSPDADIVLPDGSISRHHIKIELGPPIRVTALTDTNGTFCDGHQRVTPGTPFVTTQNSVLIQLGGAHVKVSPLTATDPVWDLMPSPQPLPPPTKAIEVVWDAGQCLVRCANVDLPINGSASCLFGLLADEVGHVVHHWDLEQGVGTKHLAPLATAIRRALCDAHINGLVDLKALATRAAGNQPIPTHDLAALGRWIVHSRRGHGYALQLHPDDVQVRRV